MERPQSRPYGTQGRKPTRNFLSLYSPAQHDPCSCSTPLGGFFESHDFLQPLERAGRKQGNKFEAPTGPVYILPGGIETYSINHISCISESQSQSQRMTKSEGVMITATQSSGSDKNDENSNCSSYTRSGFSFWEESAVKKGKRGKGNIAGNKRIARAHQMASTDGGMKAEGMPWMASMERPSQSSSTHNHPITTIRSLSSSCPPSDQKNAGFVDMLKSAKSIQEDKDDEEQEFVVKKEPSTHYKDTAHHDQKPNTPRSKHSATEQRRRSKINDRFSMLRALIPNSDRKRDKASFLLEVIEYIRFLQEKVHKYEDSCHTNNNQMATKGFMGIPLVQTGGSEPPLFKGNISLKHPQKGQTLLDSNLSCHEQTGQDSRLTNKGSSFPLSLHSNIYFPGCASTHMTAPLPSTLATESTNTTFQLMETGSCTNDCTDERSQSYYQKWQN